MENQTPLEVFRTRGFEATAEGKGDDYVFIIDKSKSMNVCVCFPQAVTSLKTTEVSNEVKEVQFVTKVKEVEALDTTEATRIVVWNTKAKTFCAILEISL